MAGMRIRALMEMVEEVLARREIGALRARLGLHSSRDRNL